MDAGQLVQHGTLTKIIRQPATNFVDEMVGWVDRPLRRSSLISVSDIVEDGQAEGAALSAETSLRDALATCLWTGRAAVPVVRHGVYLGRVTLDHIRARAKGDT
jgi:osmoprotectant transport system ATP-binding protein